MKSIKHFLASNVASIATFLLVGFLVFVFVMGVALIIRQAYRGVDVSEISCEPKNDMAIQQTILDYAVQQQGVTSMMCAELSSMTLQIGAVGDLVSDTTEEIRALEKRLGALEKVITGPRPYVLEMEPEKVY